MFYKDITENVSECFFRNTVYISWHTFDCNRWCVMRI